MTRTEMENLTAPELLELALDLERRNQQTAHLLEKGRLDGLIPISEAIRTLKGARR